MSAHQTRLQCIAKLIKFFNLPAKGGGKRARWPRCVLVNTAGWKSEIRRLPKRQVAHSQRSGLMVESVDLRGVDYGTLHTRLELVARVLTGPSRTRKQFESAVTSFSSIFFWGSGGGSISVGGGFLAG
jgi:hypothetical protein